MRRKQFTFYESFATAIGYLEDPTDRLTLYDTICTYALSGEEPDLTGCSGTVQAIFALIRPNLDSSIRKSAGGSASASESETGTSEEDVDKIPTRSRKDAANKKEVEKEVEIEAETEVKKEVEVERESVWGELRPRADDLPLDLRVALEQWLQYKAERREKYKPTSLKALLSRAEKACAVYGAPATAELITECIGSRYQGITWDKLERRSGTRSRGQPTGNPFAGMRDTQ